MPRWQLSASRSTAIGSGKVEHLPGNSLLWGERVAGGERGRIILVWRMNCHPVGVFGWSSQWQGSSCRFPASVHVPENMRCVSDRFWFFLMVFIAAPFPYLRGPRNRGGFHAKPDSMLQYHVLILGMASFNAIQLFFLQINLGDLGGVHMTRDSFVTCFGFTTFAVMCFWWKHHWCWWSTVDAWWIFMGTWSMVTAFHRFFFSQDCYNNGGLLLLCDQERGRNCMCLGKTRRDTSWHCRVFWKFELGKCCLKSHRSKPSVIENVPSSHLYTNILYCIYFVLKWSRSNINLYFFNEPRVMKSNAEDQTWYDPTASLFLEWCMMFDVVAQ